MARETTYTGPEVGAMIVMAPVMVLLIILASLPFTFWSAFVAVKLWNWFPAAYFNLQPISFWMMFGLFLAIGQFKSVQHLKDQKIDWSGALIGWTIGPAIALGIGYLVHLKLS